MDGEAGGGGGERRAEEAGKTERGRRKVTYQGHSYVFHKRLVDGKTTWSCDQKNSKACKGRVRLEDGKVVGEPSEHSHAPSATRPDLQSRSSSLRDAATASTSDPETLLSQHMLGLAPQAFNSESQKRLIRRVRSKETPAQPDSLEEMEDVPEKYKNFADGSSFLVANSIEEGERILLFGSQKSLELLGRATDVFSDGTFKIAPGIARQVYSIHAMVLGIMMPMAVAILPSQTASCYKRLFRLLKDASPHFAPLHWMTDFERAAMIAVESVWGIRADGCHFHWTQALWRRMQSEGLQAIYGTDAGLSLDFRKIFSLAFVPLPDVVPRWEQLCVSLDERLEPVLDYVEKVYIGEVKRGRRRQPDFSHRTWNVRARTLENRPRTDNKLEGWHHKMNRAICAHPNIYRLIGCFMDEFKKQQLKYEEAVAGGAPVPNSTWVRHAARLLNITQHYPAIGAQPGPGHDFNEFARGIAHNYTL
jgi:hypothetical protein